MCKPCNIPFVVDWDVEVVVVLLDSCVEVSCVEGSTVVVDVDVGAIVVGYSVIKTKFLFSYPQNT